jgi:hypothetical protein
MNAAWPRLSFFKASLGFEDYKAHKVLKARLEV